VAKAFVFVNVEAGSEKEVLEHVREIPEVKASYLVYGSYDIVAKVEADSMDHLREIITSKVRKVGNIRSTITTVVMEAKK
jgi:DNA-binding Lrp family transcriptional regulator